MSLRLALPVVAGLLADSLQQRVGLPNGGEAIGHPPGSRANVVVALGVVGRGCLGSAPLELLA